MDTRRWEGGESSLIRNRWCARPHGALEPTAKSAMHSAAGAHLSLETRGHDVRPRPPPALQVLPPPSRWEHLHVAAASGPGLWVRAMSGRCDGMQVERR